jgi:hypothetical protein
VLGDLVADKHHPALNAARRFEIGESGLRIDGTLLDRAVPIAQCSELLGERPRTVVPEIARRRPDLSNKIHVFDSHGMTANEHHAHKFVFAITFALVPEDTAFPPRQAFGGELLAFGVHLFARESEHDVAARGVPPARVFLHQWSYETPAFAIDLSFRRLRQAGTGKRAGIHRLTEVSFGIFTPEHLALRARERAAQ